MVPFAGYEVPVQFAGIIAEHLACRSAAALFDVSHMGQAILTGAGAATALEALVPGDITGLQPGRQRYTLLINEAGGIIDDLMAANLGTHLQLVLNASRKSVDLAHIAAHLPPGVIITPQPERALLALQGPKAAALLSEAASLAFMAIAEISVAGIACIVSRSGYTGEDGFEIGCPAEQAEALATLLLDRGATPAGLGARDTLRLEAGLCLYGNDIDETTNPIAANLGFAIAKRRRAHGGFLGAAAVLAMADTGPPQRLVGIRLEGRAPARAGVIVHSAAGVPIGHVTSGSFAPSLNASIALAYIDTAHSAPGTALGLMVRGQPIPGTVTPLPFIPHHYHR